MEIAMPFNFDQWIKDNKDKLKPPVANKNMYPISKDYIVMVVVARRDSLWCHKEVKSYLFVVQN